MKVAIVRPRHFDEALEETMPEVPAGCNGKAFYVDNAKHAQEIADLLNKCQVGYWTVKSTDSLDEVYPEITDDDELRKYKSTLRECIAQETWFAAESAVGYVVVPIVVGTYARVDAGGTVELPLLTPSHEQPNIRLESFTQEVAAELAVYANLRNHFEHDVSWTYIAIEMYQRHWNQRAEVEMAPADVVASLLAEAREYMGEGEANAMVAESADGATAARRTTGTPSQRVGNSPEEA